ncbi:cytochrome c oxidase subunit 2 [Tanacetum coccineum]
MRIQSRRSGRMVKESMDSLGIDSHWLDIRVTTGREEERSTTELLATSCKGKDKTTFLREEEESDARNSHVFLGLTNPAKSVFLNWKSKNKSIHFFRGAEQSKNNTDQMIVLEWLFLTIAPCDAAEPWQLGSQDAATPMMQGIINLHHDIFFFLILILVFVSRILVRALWHFQKDKNPIPQRIVHGTTIEILQTIFPSIIPMFIAIPSFALLYLMDEVVVNPAITIKAIGHQWYRSAPLHEGDLSSTKCLKNMVREASGLPHRSCETTRPGEDNLLFLLLFLRFGDEGPTVDIRIGETKDQRLDLDKHFPAGFDGCVALIQLEGLSSSLALIEEQEQVSPFLFGEQSSQRMNRSTDCSRMAISHNCSLDAAEP